MRRFLVAVDGSDNAMRAVHYAVSLARDESPAHVYLATVESEPMAYGEAAAMVDYPRLARAQRQRSEALLQPAVELLTQAEVAHEAAVLRGDPAQAIVRRAEELGCDVIVMGTRGRGPIANLVLGSTANKVIHLTKLPVTLIK